MEVVCLGLNHRSAPVEVRERFAVAESKLGEAGLMVSELEGLSEGVVLSTCNRTEFYAVGESVPVAERLRAYLRERFGLNTDDADLFYEVGQVEAARHLFRVMCGLDSMVLGETEIAGQVKKAYQAAHASGATAGVLNKLFQKSFSVAKRVRTHTGIQKGNISVGSVAVDMAEKIFGSLKNSQVMVIGAGEMSRTTAQSLMSRGAKSIIVTNRSYDKAVELADQLGGEAVTFDQWDRALSQVDVIISSTGAPHAVVRPEHVEGVRRKRKFRPIFFIDIAVPRDIDPEVSAIDEAYVYDIDMLSRLAEKSQSQRQQEVEECEAIIADELKKMVIPGLKNTL